MRFLRKSGLGTGGREQLSQSRIDVFGWGRVNGCVWRFGNAEFDELQRNLTVSGEAVELDRNCAAILGVLLREAGREVPKERLLEAGWPDRIVHENSLAKAVGRLRRALGDRGEALHAVYGHGYKLDVDVREAPALEAGGAASASLDEGSAPQEQNRRPALQLAVAVLIGLAGLAGALLWYRAPAEAEFREGPPIIADAPDTIGWILWVDDNPSNNVYEKRFFEEHRLAVHEVTNSADAFRLMAMYDYEVVISDMGRGEDRLAGIRLAEQLRQRGIDVPVVIYTVRPNGADQQRAQHNLVAEAGAQGLAVTPEEVRSLILRFFGNPARRE